MKKAPDHGGAGVMRQGHQRGGHRPAFVESVTYNFKT